MNYDRYFRKLYEKALITIQSHYHHSSRASCLLWTAFHQLRQDNNQLQLSTSDQHIQCKKLREFRFQTDQIGRMTLRRKATHKLISYKLHLNKDFS